MQTKFTQLIMFFVIFGPASLLGQTEDRWQLHFLTGVYSPSEDEMQNVYGDGITGKIVFTSPIGEHGRLKFSGNYFGLKGDPFYRSRDFDAGDAGKLTLGGFSFTLETSAKSASNPKLYFGAGIDYLFGREKIIGIKASHGEAIGMHLSISPHIKLSNKIAFVAEASYQFQEITFKESKNRYHLNLSGANLLFGLAYLFVQ